MIIRFKNWYKRLSLLQRLLCILCGNWIFWFITWPIGRWVFEQPLSLKKNIFDATFMAFWMTLIFHWKLIVSLFTSKQEHNEIADQ